MPKDYNYPDDGRLHTRYSELIRCTPGGVDGVVGERVGAVEKFELPWMEVGSLRHKEFQEEVELTGYIPAIFGDLLGEELEVVGCEQEFQSEIFPGIVLHSTPDCWGRGFIADFKMVTPKRSEDGAYMLDKKREGKYQFSKPSKRQLVIYAIQLGLHGHDVDRLIFLYELWRGDRSECLDHDFLQLSVSQEDKDEAMTWMQSRLQVLLKCMLDHRIPWPDMVGDGIMPPETKAKEPTLYQKSE